MPRPLKWKRGDVVELEEVDGDTGKKMKIKMKVKEIKPTRGGGKLIYLEKAG